MSRKSAIQHAQYLEWSNVRVAICPNFRSSLQRGKRLQLARHRATVERKHAFLTMNAAHAQMKRWDFIRTAQMMMGPKVSLRLPPKPDVGWCLDSYREACENQKRIHSN